MSTTLNSSKPRNRWVLYAALAAALILALVYAELFMWNSVDDTYIFLRYADNWLSGHGPVYNPGERVEGYTSPLWLLLLTGLTGLGLPGPLAVKLLSGASGIATLILIWLLARRLLGDSEGGSRAAPLAVTVAALSGTFAFWLLAGAMEITLLTALLSGAWYLLTGRPDADEGTRRRELALSGTLFGLAVLTRPAAGLFALVALIKVLTNKERRWRDTALFLLPPVLLVGGWQVFRLSYYGAWLPNTFHTKVELNGRVLVRGLEGLGDYLLFRLPLLAAALAAPWRKLWKRLWPLVAPTLAWWLYLVLVGGDWMIFRLYLPTLPVLAIAAAAGVNRLIESARSKPALRRLAFLPLLLLVAHGALSNLTGEPTLLWSHRREYSEYLHRTAEWLNRVSAENDLLAVTIAGVVPYFTGLETVDMLGLSDAHIAREGRSLAGLSKPGHERYDNDYVLEREPDWIILQPFPGLFLDGFFPELLSEVDLTTRGDLWRDYHLMLPRIRTVTVLHRRDDLDAFPRFEEEEWRDLWYFAPPYARITEAPPAPPADD